MSEKDNCVHGIVCVELLVVKIRRYKPGRCYWEFEDGTQVVKSNLRTLRSKPKEDAFDQSGGTPLH